MRDPLVALLLVVRRDGRGSPPDELVPAGFRLRPAAGTRLLPGGPNAVLVGGAPLRLLRLTPSGARQVAAWFAGTPVASARNARALARRLLDTGIAHPALAHPALPPAGLTERDVTVVIPAFGRPAELAECLAGLDQRVIVVDDASADPDAIAAVAAEAGARVVRRPVNGGPGAARNTGLAAATTPLVAFIDSDCVPRPGWLDRLLPHFADPAVGAVAPRVAAHAPGASWLARYEGTSSTLDMGARESIIRQGSRVPYVPGVALVVRKEAAGTGFRDDMRVGEDVDFAWRLGAAGWRMRYEPASAIGHQHRVRLRPWFSRRKDYGTSAAALELRHPGAVRPLATSAWTALAWAAVLGRRPSAGVVVTAAATALLARRIATVTGERWPVPAPRSADPGDAGAGEIGVGWTAWRLAVRLAAGGTLAAARPLGSAITRTWWPLALPAAVAVRRLRLPLAALVLTPPLLDWFDRRPPLDPARYVAARLLDDVAYSLGVWQGCGRHRTIRPLLPVIGGMPARKGRRPTATGK